MKWRPLLTPIVALVLLAVVAWRQFDWLGQVSVAEKERMQRALERELERVSEDLDREVTRSAVYFTSGLFESNDPREFLQARMGDWNESAPFPEIVKELFLLTPVDEWSNFDLAQLGRGETEWLDATWPDSLLGLRDQLLSNDVDPKDPGIIDGRLPAIILPPPGRVKRIRQRMEERFGNSVSPDGESVGDELTRKGPEMRRHMPPPNMGGPRRGFGRFPGPRARIPMVVIILDKSFLVDTYLPRLMQRYLGERDGTLSYDYQMVDFFVPSQVYGQHGNINASRAADSETELLCLRRFRDLEHLASVFEIQRSGPERRGPRDFAEELFSMAGDRSHGAWLMRVVHVEGSLAEVVDKTRMKNLAIGVAILGFLGISILMAMRSARQARHLARSQLEFVAGISHELMTPLAGIRGAGQNLAAGVVTTPERIKQYGSVIEKESDRLTNMVQQVLEFAGIQSGKRDYQLTAYPLAELIAEGLADCEALLQSKQFTVHRDIADDLGMVLADRVALRRVLQNLIGNAVKYAHDGKWLEVRAYLEKDKAVFSVADRGPGIDPNDLAQLFEPFYRGRKMVASTIPGSGLGLSLVKHIVNSHGGTIEVSSTLGAGTRFIVKLPRHLTEY